ncbi:MAG: hypothetical protein A2504_12770 [Bdellovibrionales bacterium RIFOXYD12_FULL_39_22]|nr:MAG: hypothetical protein A2385_03855 [Bdellovibrionales bacterium RIFOXYB1_FULL_39_21]OFZ40487.1 MAG: hypothetical protein A2485_02720 [Bdellovibrionales bacterium RIFOXYC12_FULL_39_17]OFZ49970.1 MAG: hypothetical protein A2404_02055 [Bdellovibrionales bacterium RIFOXYC1_FULL_39_130]OFZ77612.1 MAG: hypothetical protein A2560_04615 [Bdellovibrionales bacterium RIFOXYD1_FULL_39_84]OFZ96066.1 MAG: hypothetical protein A2504_12770 [Bdellovibrionales bacterium RIFOXYD12_FULL_39_22]HLE10645.1 2-
MKELENVVIRFSGDSGDGMQLTGTQFSTTSALMGNDMSTFPDYPSEIRAPQGTVAGVSGFQVCFGATEVNTPGDEPDVLVAMNPAALKANLADVKRGGTIIVNNDAFSPANLKKAGYESNPLDTNELDNYKVIRIDISNLTTEALKNLDLDLKAKGRCKNFCALGFTYYLFDRDMDSTIKWIESKFGKTPVLKEANILALKAGYNYGGNTLITTNRYQVPKAKIEKGKYRQMQGNAATAWGLMQAAEAAGLKLFLGSYPITPATEILQELAKFKEFGVKTFQAEDEIAGICSAIGASFGGALAATTTSGPGLALKTEAIGLGVIYEIPLVIVNVQRGGPSTGLPTKTEQADLLQSFYGRNGECPTVVVAASRPSDCFEMAYEAARLALEHMTPVILLTDGYIAQGAEPWKIPDIEKEFRPIKTRMVDRKLAPGEQFLSYQRDPKTLVRPWAIPGMAGYEHRIGGLEKSENFGNVSHDAKNHQRMVELRAEKIARVVDNIPDQEVFGDKSGDLLVVSWGGTYGATYSAVRELRKEGKRVSLMHMKYLNPMPKNVGKILKSYKKILVPELNMGQLQHLLREKFLIETIGYHKVQGQPLKITEVVGLINRELESL